MKQISVLKEVGKFLKLYRESKNVSIPELSSLSNLTEEEINKIETGEIADTDDWTPYRKRYVVRNEYGC